MTAPRLTADVDHELAVLEREHVGLVHQVRIEALSQRLRTVDGIAVTDHVNGLCGDRPTIWLDGGMVLQVRLFWPGAVRLRCAVRHRMGRQHRLGDRCALDLR